MWERDAMRCDRQQVFFAPALKMREVCLTSIQGPANWTEEDSRGWCKLCSSPGTLHVSLRIDHDNVPLCSPTFPSKLLSVLFRSSSCAMVFPPSPSSTLPHTLVGCGLDGCTSFHRRTAGVWSAVNLDATPDMNGYIETPLA